MKKVLFVLTSHDKLGNTGEKTGFGPKNLQRHIMSFQIKVLLLTSQHLLVDNLQ